MRKKRGRRRRLLWLNLLHYLSSHSKVTIL
jgi:hypothetical protein